MSSAPAPSRNALRNSPALLSGQKAPPGTASGARLPRRQHLSRGNAGGNGIKLLAMRGCKQNNPKARAGTLPKGAKVIGGGVCNGSQHRGRRAAGSRGAFHHLGAVLGERSGAPTALLERWTTFGTGADLQEFVSGWGQSFFFFFFVLLISFFPFFHPFRGSPPGSPAPRRSSLLARRSGARCRRCALLKAVYFCTALFKRKKKKKT